MRIHSRILGASLLVPLLLHAEPPSARWQKTPSSRVFIPGSLEVAPFAPPAPTPAKKVPALLRKNAVISSPDRGHTFTVIRAQASAAPDLPKPVKPVPLRARLLTPADIARMEEQRSHELMLGATVYDHRASVVSWSDRATGEAYEALCGFDVSLLEGIGEFIHDGESYRLMLAHSPASLGEPVPNVAAGSIVFLKGNPSAPAAAPIRRLQELITNEKDRLIPYQTARRQYQLAAAAWEKAHPPVPHDETFWLKPHRGSRYLAQPLPALPEIPAK